MKNTAYNEYVKTVRANMPSYNHGRTVVVLSEYSTRGKAIMDSATQWKGERLGQVYDSWSDAKQKAYDDAYEMYANDPQSEMFSICSANISQFTVSWFTPVNVVYLTANYEYHVLFDVPEFYEK